jgi:hypothetical protein
MAGKEEAEEAARIIEQLTGIPPGGRRNIGRKMGRREKREQATRVRRFLALSPELQEGVLRYAEKLKRAYGGIDKA